MQTPTSYSSAKVTALVRDLRWLAIVTRNRAADGDFYYSVATSGVYCRPSCAARLANPKNVQFHRSPAAADAAGFRACKRCKPDLWAAATGARTSATVAPIRLAVGPCSLGRVLVAASDSGVCGILFGDDDRPLVRDAQRRFPGAALVTDDAGFARLIAKVGQFVDTPAASFDLPLDLRGTEFQRRVWNALTGTPVGTTASYADIARRIAMPRAARAVAAACAANPLAVAVPCHRVVKSDGALSGYRWGVARKRTLLAREAGAA